MAQIDINSFISNVQDVARQYLFMIYLSGVSFPGNYQYLVSSTTMPPQTIDPLEVNWQGQIIKYGTTHTWDDWTVTFKVDARADIHKRFTEWSNMIHQPETGVHGAPATYMAHQRVQMLDSTGAPIREFQLRSAWPQSVGEITLDYSAKETATFDVTFSYQYAVPTL